MIEGPASQHNLTPNPLASPATSAFSNTSLLDLALAVPLICFWPKRGHSYPAIHASSHVWWCTMIRELQVRDESYYLACCRRSHVRRSQWQPSTLMCITERSDFFRVLATSGQTLDDLRKDLETKDRLTVAARTPGWRQSPTAPDTLWCHLYPTEDPFIFASTSHIYCWESAIVPSDTNGAEWSSSSEK